MLVEVVASQEVGDGIATLGEGVQVGTGFALPVHTAANGELVQNPRQAIAGEGLETVTGQVGNDTLVVSIGADRTGITGRCLPAFCQLSVQGELSAFGSGTRASVACGRNSMHRPIWPS